MPLLPFHRDIGNDLADARASLQKARVEIDGMELPVRGDFEPYMFFGFRIVPLHPPRRPVDKFVDEEIGL